MTAYDAVDGSSSRPVHCYSRAYNEEHMEPALPDTVAVEKAMASLFRLAVSGHASPVNVDLPVSPHVVDIFPGRGGAIANGLGSGDAWCG